MHIDLASFDQHPQLTGEQFYTRRLTLDAGAQVLYKDRDRVRKAVAASAYIEGNTDGERVSQRRVAAAYGISRGALQRALKRRPRV